VKVNRDRHLADIQSTYTVLPCSMLASVAEVAGRALSTRRGSGRNADMTPSANRDRFVSASQMHIELLHAPLSLLRPNDLTIRAWLGHVSLDATNIYAEADLEMKANALAHCDLPPPAKREKKRRRFSGHLDVTAARGRPRIQDAREAPPCCESMELSV
jgi:hypothetical protein